MKQGYNPAVQISKAARLVVATPVTGTGTFRPMGLFVGDLRMWTKVDLQTGAATQRMYDTFESAKLKWSAGVFSISGILHQGQT